MARGSKAAACAAILIALSAAPAAGQADLTYEVRHDHWRKHGVGRLSIDERGVSFTEASKKDKPRDDLHRLSLAYQDIQQLFLAPKRMVALTYKDRKWRLGADRRWEFTLVGEGSFEGAYRLLKDRLDQRFVAALADPDAEILWEIPAKLKGRFTGSEGVLQVGPDRIVFSTDEPEQSRTWRYPDIDNISTSGPFQLTVTTFERATTHYGNLKGFNFQLKQPLDEKRFHLLWRRLNRAKGLDFLTSLEEGDRKR
ncbi:MAG: hypothetical protein KIT09_01120 [Bryobacteraceae bacterium]|nr:hypothetical protein [Bryobacteraceae bacterium]